MDSLMQLDSMRVLIQHCDTKFYYLDSKSWTPAADEARDFRGTLAALELIRREQLDRAQLVLQFGRADMDVVLPLGDCRDVGKN